MYEAYTILCHTHFKGLIFLENGTWSVSVADLNSYHTYINTEMNYNLIIPEEVCSTIFCEEGSL